MKAPITPNAYCYDDSAKKSHSRKVRAFYRAALKQLPEFTTCRPIHFNPGGIAVWGETHLNLFPIHGCGFGTGIEAYDTTMGILVRQWDGHNSGRNHYAQTLEQFVSIVKSESSRPFVRF